MKLAEALLVRSDLQKNIAQLENRLVMNAKVQEGEMPSEDPVQLMEVLNQSISDLEKIIYNINMTNSVTIVDGDPLTKLMAKKETLLLKIKILQNFVENASRKIDRYSNKEIKVESTVNVAAEQEKIDKLSKEYRILDAKIQNANWQTELIENKIVRVI
ncbi:MAG: DIP1984 family protein [Clostridia bacterium]|nr:DIP1984 family protein [Clostridia bacterium]